MFFFDSPCFSLFFYVFPCFSLFFRVVPPFPLFSNAFLCFPWSSLFFRVFYVFLWFSLFFRVFPCFPLFSHVFLYFSLILLVFPCFSLFCSVLPCFPLFSLVFLCFPVVSLVLPCLFFSVFLSLLFLRKYDNHFTLNVCLFVSCSLGCVVAWLVYLRHLKIEPFPPPQLHSPTNLEWRDGALWLQYCGFILDYASFAVTFNSVQGCLRV